MRIRTVLGIALAAGMLAAGDAGASVVRSIPVVTQVQGATFYRTSVTISNSSPALTTDVTMRFSYRSPADGTFQVVDLALVPGLGPRRVRFFDDVVQAFKDAGRIRAVDAGLGLFGTLLVNFHDLDVRAETAAVARTYSPATGGGTLGIAYAGRCFCETGSTDRVLGAARSGLFGTDGSTRANLGIVNEGFGPSDFRVTFFNGDTGQQIEQLLVSGLAGHILEENEVFQLNNILGGPLPPVQQSVVIQVESTSGTFASAYVVQLDNGTNDGSFFFLEEE